MTGYSHKSDVIIVFGAAVKEGGVPSSAMIRRVSHGVGLMKNGVAGHLLFTGGVGRHPPAEAVVMAGLAEAQGVPRSCMAMETTSKSTLENVAFCLEIMKKKGWKSAVAVSDSYHLFRIGFTFRRMGMKVALNAAPGARRANSRWRWWWYMIREAAAMVYYSIKLL